MWEDQLSFAARHTGHPHLARVALLFTAFFQCLSVLLIAPPSLAPKLAMPIMVECVVVAVSVIGQPFLFNQLSNFELLTMSAAQIGALGLIFSEASAVAFPRKNPFSAFCAPYINAPSEGAAIVGWIQVCTRSPNPSSHCTAPWSQPLCNLSQVL